MYQLTTLSKYVMFAFFIFINIKNVDAKPLISEAYSYGEIYAITNNSLDNYNMTSALITTPITIEQGEEKVVKAGTFKSFRSSGSIYLQPMPTSEWPTPTSRIKIYVGSNTLILQSSLLSSGVYTVMEQWDLNVKKVFDNSKTIIATATGASEAENRSINAKWDLDLLIDTSGKISIKTFIFEAVGSDQPSRYIDAAQLVTAGCLIKTTITM